MKGGIRARNLERIFIILASVILGLLFFRLYHQEEKQFEEVRQRLADGTIVNLNEPDRAERMMVLLQKRFFLEDPKDIAFAGKAIERGFAEEGLVIDNIGELNKKRFNVPAGEAYSQGGTSYRNRAVLSRYLVGYTQHDSLLYERESKSPMQVPAQAQLNMGKGTISGIISTEEEAPVAGVLVRLSMVVPEDSLYGAGRTEEQVRLVTDSAAGLRRVFLLDSSGQKQLQTFHAYARTDASGRYGFNGLPDGKAFEVLPLKPGSQFGPPKGIEILDEPEELNFLETRHALKLFSTRDFNNLKKERSLIVRTPAEAAKWYKIIGLGFIVSFVVLHLVLTFRRPNADQLLLPVLMVLTGLSFLCLLSLQDPLRDRFLAQSTFYYFLGGIALIILFQFIEFRSFTTDSKLYRMLVFTRHARAGNGYPWALLALGLLTLTLLFGSGPEGSGVKVNLGPFQPSEVVKYLLIIFLSGYFATNEKFISEYASWHRRGSFFVFALVAILAAILLYLMLGDLGPAMVSCFTFIILFSFSRGDFLAMVGSVVLYILAIWLIGNLWIATGAVFATVILASVFYKRGLSESSIMVLVIIAGFMLLDQITPLTELIPGPMKRLVDRKAIWQDPWNNEVFGGDHIANAIWGMTSGGLSGQGIGEGFAKTIPEAHTDMILPSLGEEFGLAGILCIFILFLIFVHRAIIIGRQTGRSFLFYLSAGIGLSTFVQFLLIAGGSIGALPLSGVSLPFLSYGGSSLIINMMATGFLLSVSHVRGSAVQMQYISGHQDRNLVPALAAALLSVILLGVSVSRYLFNSRKWVVQPALVADRSGARIFSYNPRIAILMNRLQAGTLFDRRGRILATSNPQLVQQQKPLLVGMGLDGTRLDAMMRQRLDRFYPFWEQTFFWVGDMNTGIFMGATNGYFAEYEHLAELRGFETPETSVDVAATNFRQERFLPARKTEMTVRKRDYSALAPLLLAGINSREVAAFKKRNRDVYMTIDAELQLRLNHELNTLDSLKRSRISVVVMDASNGDVLASSFYPMVDLSNPDQLQLTAVEQNKLPFWISNSDVGFTHATQPGSTAKLATALAAFNKLGMAAAKKTILVRGGDLIRTSGYEPDEAGHITIERGIVRSNNPFFIRLANEYQLQEEMATLYMQTGMFLRGIGGYYYSGNTNNAAKQEQWRAVWRETEFRSLKSYNPNNIRRTRGKGISGMSWGQGELIATPAAMARLAAGIANKGVLIPNRYIYRVADSLLPIRRGIPVARDSQYAILMTEYMKKQSASKVDKLGIAVAGKTGTPERIARNERINDGWYVFFAPKGRGQGHLAVCVRVENTRGSSVAVRLAGADVIPVLRQMGYIKGFEDPRADSLGTNPAISGYPAETGILRSTTVTNGAATPVRNDTGAGRTQRQTTNGTTDRNNRDTVNQ